MDKKRSIDNLRARQRSVVRTLRTATFGAERPRRWFSGFLRRAAEAIEPGQADVRMVIPEEPRREDEPDVVQPHELRSQRESINSESRGTRPERHNSGINRE